MPAGRDRRLTRTLGVAGIVGIALFVGAAILALALAATGEAAGTRDTSGVFDAPVFDAYVWRVARFTLIQAGLSTLLSVAFAIPVALALARRRSFIGRIWIIRLMALPLGLPALVAALGIVGIWGRQGVVNDLFALLDLDRPVAIYGLAGILVAHVFFNMPLAVRLLLSGLDRIPGEYWLVSANLGISSFSLFRFIEWPVIRGLLSGIAGLIFMLCATSFTLVLTLGGGPAASTLEVAIYQALRFDFDPPRAIALSALQIMVTAVLLLALRWLTPPATEGFTTGRPVRRFDGRSRTAILADILVIALAALFVATPLASVLVSGLASDLAKLALDAQVHRALATSLGIAAASAALSVALATAMLTTRQILLSPRRPGRFAHVFSGSVAAGTSLVLLVPPVVIGAGWFLLLRPLGDVARFAPVVITLINTLMALPFVTRVLAPAIATHAARTGRLTTSLGISGWSRIVLVDGPGLRRPLLMALSFAAALSLGDLGAVALFGSQDMVTLPYLLYSRVGSYRTTDAAGLALLLGIVCVALTILGTARESLRERTS
ncbi:thiamine/thiamine pyrophosphate ABC transporter permease ThiP [Ferranicluibacter rubi]|uniref:Thiamine transport system permease protein ThiP n=1 Tax=Ferranicluibacter rubi TaxID=2715133 RepID=A0AA44CCJ7_9HYPH|nr:thiamine/thiamine pyrophosphate ABC transporter permease ThiP [Ferranicluibacter rubi]NHT76082.1 thiamine/thiamine pyrophosphate ABC transporter permease ThiP [Ferranicluibacter rubi]TCQ24948.1 thiamine transport system permease protein [Rhizobium sp. PP-CC-3G-465]